MKDGIIVYNLYPKLVGTMDKWIEHFDRIKEMGFNWIYINPFNSTSLSMYAIKDYYGYNPMYLKDNIDGADYERESIDSMKEQGNAMLKKVCMEAKKRGLNIMMDLVINHTASDANLVTEHPEWYKRKEDGTIKHPGAMDNGNWIEWGDLVEIDNVNATNKDELWEYWLDMINFYAGMGVKGFRCDAAYHVYPKLWEFLISGVKSKNSDVIFMAETLGCQPVELIETAETGFDYVMNSFKWWDLEADYFLKDYVEWAGKYPSLAFPENHDTERFAVECGGNRESAVAKYASCAFFCSSIATTIGFEYGFETKLDVVQTHPGAWEEKKYDISKEIKEINELKNSYKVLREDSMIDIVWTHNDSIFAFTKVSLSGDEKILVIINKNQNHKEDLYLNDIFEIMGGEEIRDISLGHKMEKFNKEFHYGLNPSEVKLFYIKK